MVVLGIIALVLMAISIFGWTKIQPFEWPKFRPFIWATSVVGALLCLPVSIWLGVDMKQFNASSEWYTWEQMTDYHHYMLWFGLVPLVVVAVVNLLKELAYRLDRRDDATHS